MFRHEQGSGNAYTQPLLGPGALGDPRLPNRGVMAPLTRARAERAGLADAVSFCRHFIADPGLVGRFALGHPLATSDRGTHFTGGARGCTDRPICSAS